jgi:hypothetical protein
VNAPERAQKDIPRRNSPEVLNKPSDSPTSPLHDFDMEIQRVIATFFVPGACKELCLDSNTRDDIVRKAASTHADPDTVGPNGS